MKKADNFNLNKWLTENKITKASLLKENKEMEVVKLPKEVKFDYEKNPYHKFISDELEGRFNGDWTEYNNGEEITYCFDLNDDYDWEDMNFTLDDFKKYIGDGICLVITDKEWYNIKIDNKTNELLIYFNHLDSIDENDKKSINLNLLGKFSYPSKSFEKKYTKLNELEINGKTIKTYTQNGDKSYNVTYDDGSKDIIAVSNDAWDKINTLHMNTTDVNENTKFTKSSLKQKIKEMIIDELNNPGEDEDFEKSSREVEFGINPNTDKEEMNLSDFFIDDEEELDEAKKKKKDEDKDEEKESSEDDPNLDIKDLDLDMDMDNKEGDENVSIDTSAVDPNIKAVQDALTQAQAAAKKINDEKLTQQIGNTITMFTRTHVANKEPIQETEESTENKYTDKDKDGNWVLEPMAVEGYLETLLPDDSGEESFSSAKYKKVKETIDDFLANELKSLSQKEGETLKSKTDDEIEDMLSTALTDLMKK